jgi:hypothetical protein
MVFLCFPSQGYRKWQIIKLWMDLALSSLSSLSTSIEEQKSKIVVLIKMGKRDLKTNRGMEKVATFLMGFPGWLWRKIVVMGLNKVESGFFMRFHSK